MYSIAFRRIIKWMGSDVSARLEGGRISTELTYALWDPYPIHEHPPFIFAVDSGAPALDNYFSGSPELYSARLIRILRDHATHFELFPTSLIDKDTGQTLDWKYSVFHLMDVLGALDKEKSAISEKGYLISMVLKESFRQERKMFFRLKGFENFILIHDDLRAVFERESITGFHYHPIEDFHGL